MQINLHIDAALMKKRAGREG